MADSGDDFLDSILDGEVPGELQTVFQSLTSEALSELLSCLCYAFVLTIDGQRALSGHSSSGAHRGFVISRFSIYLDQIAAAAREEEDSDDEDAARTRESLQRLYFGVVASVASLLLSIPTYDIEDSGDSGDSP